VQIGHVPPIQHWAAGRGMKDVGSRTVSRSRQWEETAECCFYPEKGFLVMSGWGPDRPVGVVLAALAPGTDTTGDPVVAVLGSVFAAAALALAATAFDLETADVSGAIGFDWAAGFITTLVTRKSAATMATPATRIINTRLLPAGPELGFV
jgi:hypothetical protein